MTTIDTLRPELPQPIPPKMLRMPVHRGYPVPYFVAWIDEDGHPVERGSDMGAPDFRILFPGVIPECHNNSRCWLCGGHLGSYRTFVIGPMCAVNRTSAEPPGHRECADWSARACPFLSRPHAKRREYEGPKEEPPGIALLRNPGVALVWTTRNYRTKRAPNGVLFDIGDPTDVRWYAEGREATREEIMRSIETGLPSLQEMATAEGPAAEAELARLVERAMTYVPA